MPRNSLPLAERLGMLADVGLFGVMLIVGLIALPCKLLRGDSLRDEGAHEPWPH